MTLPIIFEKKAAFIRSGRLSVAFGEENLLAYYAIRLNDEGFHDFVQEDGDALVEIKNTHYESLIKNPRYLAKKKADEISYLWDKLIHSFTTYLLDGTSITLWGHNDFELRKYEIGVRYMAMQPRFVRRSLGAAFSRALTDGKKKERFFSSVMVRPIHEKGNDVAFYIVTFKYLDWMNKMGGYERYRQKRFECALVYGKYLLVMYPHLKHVIGVTCEPPDQGHGGSEDLIYIEQTDWSDEDRQALFFNCKMLHIFQDEMKVTEFYGNEFPVC